MRPNSCRARIQFNQNQMNIQRSTSHSRERRNDYESAVWHGLENDRASPDRAGVASTSNQRVGMRAPKSWALELPMAAPGYWKGNRAGGGAALPTSVTLRTPTKFGLFYLQA